ncbi:MAG: response regulator [Magnetococcales bacterium]|nr:response regulator [Magnetococcales bacterium]
MLISKKRFPSLTKMGLLRHLLLISLGLALLFALFEVTIQVPRWETLLGDYRHIRFFLLFSLVSVLVLAFFKASRELLELDRVNATLVEEKEYIRNIIQGSASMIVSVDADRRIVEFNAAAQKAYGYSLQEIRGQTVDILYADPDESSRVGEAILAEGVFSGEVLSRRKNGQTFPLLVSAALLHDVEGRIIGSVGNSIDLTREKEADQLKRAKEVAELASQAKSEFLANMSHEIRTPMNGIVGLSHLVMKTDMTAKQYDYLRKIQSSAHALLGILNDILDFSKIEAGKLKMESIDFQLDDVFENLAGMVCVRVEKKGLELLFKRGEDVPNSLVGDPLRLGQVLLNLANNAVKFTESGEIIISVNRLPEGERQGVAGDQAVGDEDRLDPDSKSNEGIRLQFSVQDTGIGMTGEQCQKLFQAFTQADSSTTRKFGGTGLGLSICKQLVKLMDGQIDVISTLGQGSLFTFSAHFGRPALPVKKNRVPRSELLGMRVLVVDDNESSRNILCDVLESFAMAPHAVNSGPEALVELERSATNDQEKDYKLIFMDYKMPGMNGIETARRVRGILALASPPPVLLVTAYGREEVIRKMEEAFVDGYILKPFNASLVLDAIITTLHPEEGSLPVRLETKSDHREALGRIRGARVLLVEDNTINQQVAIELLEGLGMTVILAENGKDAVAAVARGGLDLVLMDIQMPEMDGLEATRWIRKDERRNNVPILATTAHAMDRDREKCLAAGMNDHLTKPLDPEVLAEALIQWITPGERAYTPPTTLVAGEVETVEMPADLPGVDMVQGLRRVGSNRKLFKKLLGEFYQDNRNLTATLQEFFERGDLQTVLRLIHTLKGVSGSIGANALHQAAQDLESAITRGDERHYERLLGRIQERLTPLLGALGPLTQTLKQHDPAESVSPIWKELKGGDIEKLAPLLQKLSSYLEEMDVDSEACFVPIREIVAHSQFHDLGEKIGQKIDCFDFEEAMEMVQELKDAVNATQDGKA